MAKNQTTPKSTTQPVARGFAGLCCPFCGNDEGTVRVNLTEVTLFSCSECDAEFGPDDIRAMIEMWEKVLAWVELAPAIE